jgi:hypothetical protein
VTAKVHQAASINKAGWAALPGGSADSRPTVAIVSLDWLKESLARHRRMPEELFPADPTLHKHAGAPLLMALPAELNPSYPPRRKATATREGAEARANGAVSDLLADLHAAAGTSGALGLGEAEQGAPGDGEDSDDSFQFDDSEEEEEEEDQQDNTRAEPVGGKSGGGPKAPECALDRAQAARLAAVAASVRDRKRASASALLGQSELGYTSRSARLMNQQAEAEHHDDDDDDDDGCDDFGRDDELDAQVRDEYDDEGGEGTDYM